MIEIKAATTETDFENAGEFYRAFGNWLEQTYPEIMFFMEPMIKELDIESKSLQSVYASPTWKLLIATLNGQPAGTVGLSDLGNQVCEMRRMFVDPNFRGHDIGRQLAQAIIAEAREMGYERMKLSTGPRHYAALGLYESLGFKDVSPKTDGAEIPENIPADLARGVVTMELDL